MRSKIWRRSSDGSSSRIARRGRRPVRRGTGSRQLGLSAGDVLGCPSTVAGDAGVANSGVARRARPVEDIGFAGLAVAGHSDKSGFDCAVLSAGGHWLLHVSGKVGQGCWQDTSTFVNVGEVRQGLLGRRLGQSGAGALVGGGKWDCLTADAGA